MENNYNIEELLGAKRQLDSLLTSMVDGIVILDSSGHIIQFNQSALSILGLTVDQLLYKTFNDLQLNFIAEDLLPFCSEDHPAAFTLRTGQAQTNRLLGINVSEQRVKWLKVSTIPLFKDNEKKLYQVLVTFLDITEQKLKTEQLLKKEHELSRILNNLPALVGYWDCSLFNVHANEAYSKYFGKTPNEIKGKHISELLGEALYIKNILYIEGALNGQAQTFEREISLPDGTKKQTIANYLPDVVDGIVQGFFVIVTDISYIKKLENERREIEAKIVNSSKMASLGEMAGGIAHEINTPLATILSRSSSLIEKIKEDQYGAIHFMSELEKIDDTVQRIANIIRALLTFSRNEKNQIKIRTSLKEILEHTLDLCYEKFKSKGVKLIVDIRDSCEVNCHSIQISQIFLNLFNNSLDAIENENEKWIKVEIFSNNNLVQVCIIDSGKGISPDVAEKMMTPFFTTKGIGNGTGLGLSISNGLAEVNGGTLKYMTKDGHTCFVLEFPQEL